MPITDPTERKILASGLLALTLSLGALTAVLSGIAFDHMRWAAGLCASPVEHCWACYGAALSLVVTLIAGSAGLSLLRPSGVRIIGWKVGQ